MMKRLACVTCVTLGLVLGVACSWGGGAPQGAAGRQGGTAAGAQAPAAGAPAAAAAPAQPGATSSGAQPAVGQAAALAPPAAATQAAAPTATPPVTSTRTGTATAAPPAAATQAAPPAAAAPAAGAQTAAPAGAVAAAPAAPPQPRFREVIIPAGMTMTVALETAVSSDQSKVEDTVRARLIKAIVVGDTTAVPEGTQVAGSVLEVTQAGRVQGRALVAFRFDRLRLGEELYTIRTARIAREAEATRGEDAKKIGIGAAAGAAVGAIAGGKKGAAVGAAVGAGAGTGVVVATRGEEVRFVQGAVVTTRIDEPIKIQVPMK